jgi:hypothetical protein
MSWTPSTFLESGPAHPVPVDVLLLRWFGRQYYDWEPETLRREIHLEFHATPPAYNMDCIQAVRTIHIDDRFSKDYFLFEKIVMALNNIPVDFRMGQLPEMGQIMSAQDDIRIIRPVDYSEEVLLYIKGVEKESGYADEGDREYCKLRKELMKTQLKDVLAFLDGEHK